MRQVRGRILQNPRDQPVGGQYRCRYPVRFVQTPIGVTDYYNVGSLLKQREKTLADLQSKLSIMSQQMNQIAQLLNQMRR
jgi:hypothetical protein